eukprot:6905395-Ditylum_brightwellii.AAC.1
MVAFESSVNIPCDGLQFQNENNGGGSLAWAARDTSKPGRERNDGKECWVVQSVPGVAEEIIASASSDKSSFEDIRQVVREQAKELLLKDFVNVIATLQGEENNIPNIVSAVGHRWSAAFPHIPPSSTEFKENEEECCMANGEEKFVACGDYIGDKYAGRIE